MYRTDELGSLHFQPRRWRIDYGAVRVALFATQLTAWGHLPPVPELPVEGGNLSPDRRCARFVEIANRLIATLLST